MNTISINIMELAKEITAGVPILSSRFWGNQVRTRFISYLSEVPIDGIVRVSFFGVQLMDSSFADEVFGFLASERSRNKISSCPYYLADLNPTSIDNLEAALVSRLDREKKSNPSERVRNNCVLPVLDTDGKLKLFGKYENHVFETFELLLHSKQVSTDQLAEELNLKPSAASTRLKVLYDLGLAVRQEVRDQQGKQFIYYPLV